MISAIIILSLMLVISGTASFILADINNKLDLTNEDLMEENEVLRETTLRLLGHLVRLQHERH